jgi:hypothetical protein
MVKVFVKYRTQFSATAAQAQLSHGGEEKRRMWTLVRPVLSPAMHCKDAR